MPALGDRAGAAALRAGACSARELVAAHLARIERIDPLVNAIVTRHAGARARGGRRGRPAARAGRGPAAAARSADRPQGSPGHRRRAHDLRLAGVSRPRPRRRLAAGRAAAPGGRDLRRQDQHARVGRRLAHVQPRVRRDAQPLGHDALGRRLERRRRGGAGLPDGADRRRQRSRRVAAQPGGLERRRSDCAPRRASSRAGPSRRPGCRSRSRARWRARPAISRCCWA